MVKIARVEGFRAVCVAFALAVPMFLASCASDRPLDTNFDWNLESDGPAHHSSLAGSDDYAPARDSSADVPAESAPKPEPGWYHPPAKPAVDVTPLPPPGKVSFAWPVQGRVISDFGSTTSGQRNDGINIATALGTPIHAAASGVVSYAGNELKGYGNLVLIRHDGGYVTAYAHADSLLVSRGDAVMRGQVIGYAGATGDVTQPQVHFEIRRDTAPVNPRPLLIASR
jgi:murein DD-endopeptidase MepM/ murein hydrolase activator NlpD